MKELIEIQSELKAPKDQDNKFGGYKYRSAEDILEAVKPLLKKLNCTLTLTDSIELIGDRHYIVATAKLTNSEGGQEVTTAYAREELTKKGYDAAQITGSASSYARKYALNGLFCIDDTKDPDATNTHGKEEQPTQQAAKPKPKTKEQKPEPKTEVPQEPVTEDDIDSMVLDIMSSKDLKEITDKWNTYNQYDKNKKITNAIRARRKELNV